MDLYLQKRSVLIDACPINANQPHIGGRTGYHVKARYDTLSSTKEGMSVQGSRETMR